ncbi:MAG: two-component system, NarL family, sensor kinase [Acidimicrobiaceae bacterium]|jgi:signal transduction histidine kinase|nr:two-component system, NarL family, sensor kinase [Acidimicrobiaceae bacterium]
MNNTRRRRRRPGVSSATGRRVVVVPVIQFAVIGLAAVVIVGLATATASRRVGQREAISDVRTTTLIKAQGLVEPVVTNGLPASDPAAVEAVAKLVEQSVVDASLVRVKVWTADGTIVYSNASQLQGKRYPLGADELASLHNGLIQADVSDLSSPENRYEHGFGKLLEVYLPIHTPDGQRLLFEAYYRYDAVSAAGRQIWGSFAPVSVGSLIALELLQIPLAWSLAARLRQRQRERERLLQHAVDASDIERRRIASDLHDGVVQDLVGMSFALAAAARQESMPTGAADKLRDASDSLRTSVTALRSTLVDIYPRDLAELGLAGGLDDLAGDASANGLQVNVTASGLPSTLPRPVTSLLYRAVREALRNVERHASASRATVRAGADRTSAWVSVADDGTGFDPEILQARAVEGHLGLRGLEGVVRDAGGLLRVESEPGRGTTVFVEVPIP